MEVQATVRRVRIAPRKARLVVDMVRSLDALDAKKQLQTLPKRSAGVVYKLLNSAIANAEHNNKLKVENLYIVRAFVDEGPTLKRWMPRAFGRATQIRKRTSSITIVLSEKQGAEESSEKEPASKKATTSKLETAGSEKKKQPKSKADAESKPKEKKEEPAKKEKKHTRA